MFFAFTSHAHISVDWGNVFQISKFLLGPSQLEEEKWRPFYSHFTPCRRGIHLTHVERYITDLLGSLQEICTNNLGFSFLHQKRIQKHEFSELNKQLFALRFWRHLPVYCSLFLDHFLSVVITSSLSQGNHCSQLPQPVLSMFCSQLQLKPVPNSLHRNLILLPLMKWSLNEASRAGGLKQKAENPPQEASPEMIFDEKNRVDEQSQN